MRTNGVGASASFTASCYQPRLHYSFREIPFRSFHCPPTFSNEDKLPEFLGHTQVLESFRELSGSSSCALGRGIWLILAVLVAVIAVDNWYNYYIAPIGIHPDKVGFRVGVTILVQLCYSFFPFLFAVSVMPSDWSPTVAFSVNLLFVTSIDVIQKWASFGQASDSAQKWLLGSRLILFILVLLYVTLFLGKWPTEFPAFGHEIPSAVVLLGWLPYRLIDHQLRVRYANPGLSSEAAASTK